MGKIFKSLKKVTKKTLGAVKKYWKEILIAVAIVFTAGVATVGLAGMSAAYATATAATAAGGLGMSSFGAALYVGGSTMWAGMTAIAGSMGIGAGAQGFVAGAAGMQGATLGTGALAAKMGGNVAQVNMANAATNATGAGGSGLASSAGGTMGMTPAGASKGFVKGTEQIANQVATKAGGPALSAANPATSAAPEAAKTSLLSGYGSTVAKTGLTGLASGYIQGMMAEENDPLAYFGVNVNGKDAEFMLPGQIDPATGEPMTEADVKAYNEFQLKRKKGQKWNGAGPEPITAG